MIRWFWKLPYYSNLCLLFAQLLAYSSCFIHRMRKTLRMRLWLREGPGHVGSFSLVFFLLWLILPLVINQRYCIVHFIFYHRWDRQIWGRPRKTESSIRRSNLDQSSIRPFLTEEILVCILLLVENTTRFYDAQRCWWYGNTSRFVFHGWSGV